MDRNRYQEFVESLQRNVAEGLVKVHFTFDPDEDSFTPAGESVWAHPIGKKYAKIGNIPFFMDEVSIDDIVEIVPNENVLNLEFVRLISRGSYKAYLRYEKGDNDDQTRANFKQVCEHIRGAGCKVEGAVPGVAMIAVPTTMSFQEAVALLNGTPHLIDHGLQDADESDFDVDIDSIPDE